MTPPLLDVTEGRVTWTALYGEAFALLRELPTASVDAVIDDPPYSAGWFARANRMDGATNKCVHHGTKLVGPDFTGDNRDQHTSVAWCTLRLSECLRVPKVGPTIGVFTDSRQLPTIRDRLQCGGWVCRGTVVWEKTAASRPHLARFSQQREYVIRGSAGPLPDREELGAFRGLVRHPVDRDTREHHPTAKPTAVMQALARICPREGIILPFAGAKTAGRRRAPRGAPAVTRYRRARSQSPRKPPASSWRPARSSRGASPNESTDLRNPPGRRSP